MFYEANPGLVDYNSWQESEKGLKLAARLSKDTVLAEGIICAEIVHTRLIILGYKQYDTGRTYMARMGDWREDKDVEIELDGVGGVNILVKAEVHRSGS